jgi:hypothetical protein
MKNQFFPPLITAVETFTQDELAMAPELLTLAALDASLLAVCEALREASLPWPQMYCPRIDQPAKAGKHVADAICILANALRTNLSAYHATIQKACEDEDPEDSVEF